MGRVHLRAWFALGVGRWKSVVMLPEEIWDFAERLRAEAVPVVERYFRAADLAVEHKADVSPVTRADKAIELRWREMIAETFPDHGIVAEEGDTVGADREFVWVLDPIKAKYQN